MSKLKTNIVVKPHQKEKNWRWVYFINVPTYFARVQEPIKGYDKETEEYRLTCFVDEASKDLALDEFLINKEFKLVGKDKDKKRNIKYPLSSQVDEGKTHYDGMEGLYGVNLAVSATYKNGEERKLTVIDKDLNAFDKLIGNGSICTIKCFGYMNQDDQIVVNLNTVQVIDLVAYEGKSADGLVEDDILGGSYKQATFSDSKAQTTEQVAKPAEQDESLDDDIPF